MRTLENAFANALLADATYALKNSSLDGLTGSFLANDLDLKGRMTPELAKYLGDHYTVVNHIETGDVLGSGFDATVWRENSTGKLTVSMQGTSGLQDFLRDADLAVTGNARSQIVDMVNWWFKITTPVGQNARQIALTPVYDNSTPPIELGTQYTAALDVPGTGLISASNLIGGIEVNGHSLGGYLASAFTRLFGNQANVAHTSTFNSAGFAPGSEPVFTNLQNLIGVSYGLGRFPSQSQQTNYFAKHGLNVTTNSFWFSQQGQRIELFNEASTAQLPNHFMYRLTDTLALGNAMSQLDTSVDTARMNLILSASSNRTEASVEYVFDALLRALKGPAIFRTTVGDASDSATTRLDYHAALSALQQ